MVKIDLKQGRYAPIVKTPDNVHVLLDTGAHAPTFTIGVKAFLAAYPNAALKTECIGVVRGLGGTVPADVYEIPELLLASNCKLMNVPVLVCKVDKMPTFILPFRCLGRVLFGFNMCTTPFLSTDSETLYVVGRYVPNKELICAFAHTQDENEAIDKGKKAYKQDVIEYGESTALKWRRNAYSNSPEYRKYDIAFTQKEISYMYYLQYRML